MQGEKKYWFAAKRYGWGWGAPVTWQGWLVNGVYIVLLIGGTSWLKPAGSHGAFLLYAFGLTACLLLVCWLKGEPPRWRSGKQD